MAQRNAHDVISTLKEAKVFAKVRGCTLVKQPHRTDSYIVRVKGRRPALYPSTLAEALKTIRSLGRRPYTPEIIGNWNRGAQVPPPVFPETCRHCGAKRTDNPDVLVTAQYGMNDGRKVRIGDEAGDKNAGVSWVTYECGGYYRSKPQIQNHTDYWWGTCGYAFDWGE